MSTYQQALLQPSGDAIHLLILFVMVSSFVIIYLQTLPQTPSLLWLFGWVEKLFK